MKQWMHCADLGGCTDAHVPIWCTLGNCSVHSKAQPWPFVQMPESELTSQNEEINSRRNLFRREIWLERNVPWQPRFKLQTFDFGNVHTYIHNTCTYTHTHTHILLWGCTRRFFYCKMCLGSIRFGKHWSEQIKLLSAFLLLIELRRVVNVSYVFLCFLYLHSQLRGSMEYTEYAFILLHKS